MKKIFVFCFVGVFLMSLVFAENSISGKLYDNIGLLDNDVAVQAQIDSIAKETGAVVVIFLEDKLTTDYNSWARETGKKMRLGEVGEPKKNVLIGYFKEDGIIYVVSKKGSEVETSLKDKVASLMGEAIDSKDDEKFLDALKVLGEGLGGAKVEGGRVEDEEIEEISADLSPSDLGIVENCEEGLDFRKEFLEIPDKLCYWEAVTQLYDETCDNLNREQISDIFERKEEYRLTNNPDWPSLELDGDFCVSVFYDCEIWDEKGRDPRITFGLASKLRDGSRRSYINPYIRATSASKEKIKDTLLHEGLHTVQRDAFEINLFDDLYEESEHSRKDELADPFFDEMSVPYGKIVFLLEYTGDSESEKHVSDLELVHTEIILPSESYDILVSVSEFLKSKNVFNSEVENDLHAIYELSVEAFKVSREDFVESYLIEKVEIDPRLSIVHRWWFDETAPNCQIIDNEIMAREVFDKFLAENFLSSSNPAYYKIQYQLSMILDYYDGDEREEVYSLMVNRLPGLAQVESVDDGNAYA